MPGRISKETATNTMFFIAQDEILPDRRRDVTYAWVVCNYRDEKKEKERTCITMVGSSAVGVPQSNGKLVLSPPIVMRVLSFSFF